MKLYSSSISKGAVPRGKYKRKSRVPHETKLGFLRGENGKGTEAEGGAF